MTSAACRNGSSRRVQSTSSPQRPTRLFDLDQPLSHRLQRTVHCHARQCPACETRNKTRSQITDKVVVGSSSLVLSEVK